MNARRLKRQRRGTVLPMLATSIVVLMGFVALAIDLGMLANARVQAQNVADVTALTTLRTLNGNPDSSPSVDWPSQNGAYNSGNAPTAGFTAASANSILGAPPASTQLLIGSYSYSTSAQAFQTSFPAAPAGSGNTSAIISPATSLSAVQATVTSSSSQKTFFAGVFGVSAFRAVTATAQAVFRPRDFALVMDFSGSMSLGSQMAYTTPLFNVPLSRSNNPDTVYPKFGPYSGSNAQLQYTGASQSVPNGGDTYIIPPSNMTFADPSNVNRAPICLDFYSTATTVTPKVRAFTSEVYSGGAWTAPATSATPQIPGGWTQGATPGPTVAAQAYATTPGGDQFAYTNGSTTTYASKVSDILGGTTYNANWERDGYDYIYSNNNLGVPVGQRSEGAAYYAPDAATYTAVSGKTPTGTAAAYSSPYNQFQGYTQGPTFWGKTFAMWPPDPRRPLASSDTGTLQMYLGDLGIITTNKDASSTTFTWSSTTPGSTYLANAQKIFTANTANANSTWPWPNDGGSSLSAYLNGLVVPTNGKNGTSASTTGTVQTMTLASTYTAGNAIGYQVYCAIMRIYNRAYMVKGYGGSPAPADWRRRFFSATSNSTLYDSSGNWQAPTPNYREIIYWLKNCGPNPFPNELHAGNITYYLSIPDNPGNNTTKDEKFWKAYIDYVLINTPEAVGYGDYFTFGTVSVNAAPSGTPGPWTQVQYMNYSDNPKRPNMQMWFGPLTMVDWLSNQVYWVKLTSASNRNWLPGNCHEAPLYSAKIGIAAALSQMQSNQPNDCISLVYYSTPQTSQTASGCYNCVRAPMGLNYDYAISSLWYPQATLNSDGTTNTTYTDPLGGASPGEVYANVGDLGGSSNAMMLDVPHSKYGTNFSMGLMLAYNQFLTTDSSDNTLRNYVTAAQYPRGMAGGLGRRGAQKIVIFETDGIVNGGSSASLISVGAIGSTPAYKYYKIRYDPTNPGSSEYPTSAGSSPDYNSYAVIDQMKSALGTSRKPFRLYALGFGPIYSSTAADYARGKGILEQMQSTGTPTATAAPVTMASNQFIVGTDDQMAVLLQQALTTILQGGLQCALVK